VFRFDCIDYVGVQCANFPLLSILTLASQRVVLRIDDKFFIQMLLHAEKSRENVGRKRTLLPHNEIRGITEKGIRGQGGYETSAL